MVGHKRRLQDSFCPGGGTGAETGIFGSTASVSTSKTSSTEAKGRNKEVHSGRSGFFACEGSHRASQRPEPDILLESVPGKKTDSGLRPVINLRGLNCYINKKTFRMSTIKYVSQII